MAHYSVSPWPVIRITSRDVMAPRALVVSISNLMVGKDCGAYSGKVNADQKGKFNACKALIVTVPPLLESCPHNWYSIKPLLYYSTVCLLVDALRHMGYSPALF